MAILFGNNRNGVAQRSNPSPRVAQHVVGQFLDDPVAVAGYLAKTERNVTRGEFEALQVEVAALRALIARKAVAPAQKSRAEYYREYRKRSKS